MHHHKAAAIAAGLTLESKSVDDLVHKIDEHYPFFLRLTERISNFYSRLSLLTWAMAVPMIGILKVILGEQGEGPCWPEDFIATRVSGWLGFLGYGYPGRNTKLAGWRSNTIELIWIIVRIT